eukprot:14718536-Heterocapsa_arctica.AAC.1
MDKLEEFKFQSLNTNVHKEDVPLHNPDKRKTTQGGQKTMDDKACKKAKVTREMFDDSQSDGVLLAS